MENLKLILVVSEFQFFNNLEFRFLNSIRFIIRYNRVKGIFAKLYKYKNRKSSHFNFNKSITIFSLYF